MTNDKVLKGVSDALTQGLEAWMVGDEGEIISVTKPAEWVYLMANVVKCSACGFATGKKSDYCPKCGRRMVRKDDKE